MSLRLSPVRFAFPRVVLAAGLVTVAALLLAACGKNDKPATTAKFTTDDQKVSYGLGYNTGKSSLDQPGLTLDKEAFRLGLEDGMGKAKPRLTDQELQAAFQAFQQRMIANLKAEGDKQLADGAKFLEANRKRAGVKTTASGLQYEVLKSGSGPKAKPTSTVVVAYHGTLLDGTVFDSSVERGETATLQVNQVIPGWVEALQLMSVGDKWKLFIPANLAYGPRPRGKIPPNSTLVFEIEVKQIK